jgi:hypothetical protein
VRGLGRVPQHADARKRRNDLSEQLELPRLAMNPFATGSPTDIMTIGMLVVAFFAAWTPSEPRATITSTWSRTSSAASPDSRSNCPSEERCSISVFCPSM